MQNNNFTNAKAVLHRYAFLLYTLPFLFVTAFLTTSCDDDDDDGDTSLNDNAYVNNWIKENMDYYYYWNTAMGTPASTNANPADYFESLLNPADRFSWIQEDYQELLNSLQGITKEPGFEYVLYRETQDGTTVIGQIVYVKPNSPASAAGLKRGDVFTQVNGQIMTTTNFQSVLGGLGENFTLRYRALVVGENRFEADKNVSIQPVEYAENPNFLSKVIDISGRKVGYYVYNLFATGTNNAYDKEMDNIFANFKSQGITDLVLDLRFNSGGAESSARNLASLIGKGTDPSKVFARRQYNSNVENEIKNTPNLGEAFLTTRFLSKGSNVGDQLTNNRVYILTGSRTASASEIIINSLRPFMDVYLIGNVTVGKGVGSISIYEENDPKNTWGMQPIIMRFANSEGNSYDAGFQPNIANADNNLYLYPLGDVRESLLNQALQQITGQAVTGRTHVPTADRDVVGHSLDFKKRSFQIIVDNF